MQIYVYFAFHDRKGCLFTLLEMPSKRVRDACYTPITGIPYSVTRLHLLLCKAS